MSRCRVFDGAEVVPGLHAGPRLTPEMVASDPYFVERPDEFYLELHDLYLHLHGDAGNELLLDLWMIASAIHSSFEGTP